MGCRGVTRCTRCKAEVSDWEIRSAEVLRVRNCWCSGLPKGVARDLSNLAYTELCQKHLTRPVKVHDVIRFVKPQYQGRVVQYMNVTLSSGRRFCWGGQSLYGLARHGLIPGARSLAEAAYAVLLAAPRELYFEEVDFIMEQLNNR